MFVGHADLVALSDAADLVCEYLSTKWSDKLRAKLGVMEVSPSVSH